MAVPQITASADKASYVKGAPVVVTVSVAADTIVRHVLRTINISGHDDEGNTATVNVTVDVTEQVPDSFTLDSVKWMDTNQAFTISGLTATGTA
jgi:hypothetical protein